jgi:endonuclease G
MTKIIIRNFIIGFIVGFTPIVYASCPQNYPNGLPIAVPNTVELCSSFYVSVYDKVNKRVVFVSEKLSKGSKVGSATRVNAFRSDGRVGNRSATNRDYVNSGYDRGHMAPAADASNAIQMSETFLLTNMTPQDPKLNRGEWNKLEEKVRHIFATSNSDVWVMTAAIYGPTPVAIGNNIPVPTGYWKVIYSNKTHIEYYADNKAIAKVLKTKLDNPEVIIGK